MFNEVQVDSNSSPVEANNSKSVPFGPAKPTVEAKKLKKYRSLGEAKIQFPPFYRPSTALAFIMKFLVLLYSTPVKQQFYFVTEGAPFRARDH